MGWASRFDPISESADMGTEDRRVRKSRRAEPNCLREDEPILAHMLRARQKGFNGGPPLTRKTTEFSSFAASDFGLISRKEAGEIVSALAPFYRRLDTQPGYLKNPDWRESLLMMRRYAGGEKIDSKNKRNLLKQFSYRMAEYFAVAGDLDSAVPHDLVPENLFSLMRSINPGIRY